MWIKCTNENTESLYNGDFMDEPVEFSSKHTAQVTEELGEKMVSHYSSVVRQGEEVEETEEVVEGELAVEEVVEVDGESVDELSDN